MLSGFKSYISDQQLCKPTDQLLLAVSGGVDSVVMLELFSKARYTCHIAHCNFKLRGKASDQDEALVRQLAEKYDMPVHIKSFNTEEFALNNQVSTQMAARTLRYQWFEEIMRKNQLAYLATAHHMDDHLETALFNLTKGTGVSGLRGILPKRDNKIRPLLFADKASITDFAKENNLVWREDASNASNKYSRNLIRNAIIPQLSSINPDIVQTFSRNAKKVRAAELIVKQYIDQQMSLACQQKANDLEVDMEVIENCIEPEFVLASILKTFGFNMSQAEDIYCHRADTGKLFYSSSYQLVVNRGKLNIVSNDVISQPGMMVHPDLEEAELNAGKLKIAQMDRQAYHIDASARIAALDFDRLKFPLEIRRWQHGDWFYPLGMNHKKKLSDFLIDEKVARHQKDMIQVLVSGSEIVWVIGYRIDDRYKINPDTRHIYELKLL